MKKTFLKLAPEYCDSQTSLFHILPIPYEGTVCFNKGTSNGVDAILDVSDQLEYIDEKSRRPFWRFGAYTHEPVPEAPTPRQEMERIEETARRLDLFRCGRFPIALGGEHSISGALIRVAAEKYSDLSVIQFDAHGDLRDQYEPGGRDSHACVMARALEVVESVVQVGIRSFCAEEVERFPRQVDAFVTPEEIEDNFDAALEKILWRSSQNVYLTIDMDVFDPSVAPGVGTPEPGGLTWRQVVRLVESIVGAKNVIGADVVETAPLGGTNVVTEYAAAKLVAKIMNAVSMKKGF